MPPADAQSDANEVGELRARYPEAARLAEGAEGGTFVAREHGGTRVVCKPVDPAALPAVRRAFDVLRRVSSPHLPAPRELWVAPAGRVWLVTDWVDGAPLGLGPAPLDQVLGEALGVARGLAAIHAAGTHHGDVSLANVIRTPTRACVLVDLAELGRHGTGTPGFLAPEVLAGGGGPEADRFALGCLVVARLTGELPLRRPQALLALDRAGIGERIAACSGWSSVPASVRELVLGLLDPDRTRRLADDDAIVHRLEQLHLLARSDGGARQPSAWQLPSRWPYRGAPLGEVVGALRGPEAPRLLAIVGPAHSGRTRTVEEIVQRLQAADPTSARLLDEAAPGTWLEAWLDLPAGQRWGWRGERVLGGEGPEQRAATLAAAARLAVGTAVVVVPSELGDALERSGPEVRVLRMRPWIAPELDEALAPVLEGDRRGWAEALVAQTGGWSGRVVRAVTACAERGIERPEQIGLGDAALAPAPPLGPRHAAAILAAHWSGDPGALADVPTHLHDGARAFGSSLATARHELGDTLRGLATRRLAELRAAARSIPLAVAIDAEDVAATLAALDAAEPESSSPVAAALVAWAERARLPGRCNAAAARALLSLGMPTRALALADRDADVDGELVLEGARALQRLGRPADALDRLAVVESPAAAGLRARLLVDLGRAREVVDAASAAPPIGTGLGVATWRLWIGYARMGVGQRDAAVRELDAALQALGERDDARAAGVRARADQLLGNLAHDGGELEAASLHWASAAAGFVRAGEPLGGLALRGSLAGLAIVTFAGRPGIEHGRAAVRGLLAREQYDALATAALNLAQLLARHGEVDELDVLAKTITSVLGPWASPGARARVARVLAESDGARCLSAAPTSTAWLDARRAFERSARLLGAAELHAEAAEGHVRAAACARRHGRHDLAAVDLAAAGLEATRAGDDDPWRIAIEQAWIAIARRDRDRLQRWCEPAQLDRIDAWVRSGQLERAWAVARVVWGAASVRLPGEHPIRQRALQQLRRVQEIIMDKTPSSDRTAVRTSLWADGEREALRELLGDPVATSARPVAAATPSAAPASEGRTERLLRIHRRLAREDRLDPLLEQVIDAVMDLTDAERGAVVVVGPTGERREVTRELGGAGQGVQLSHSIIERVLATAEPVLSVDAAADDRFDGSRSISHLNLRSVLAVPMRFRGELLGAIYVDHRLRRGNFDDDDLTHVEEFAELAALAVAHARALDEVRQQAERLTAQHAQLTELVAAREAEVVGLRARVQDEPGDGGERHGIVGSTPAMQKVYRLVDRLADTDVPVVIYGESGTGKELVARAIHRGGIRRTGPFVAENCGAIPETLLESVLFGHAKGAFTGADRARIGLFEAAQGGTIFLDEVGEMSPGMQTKLLRVLQEGEVRRVGENASRPIDVRVIAASNRDLDQMVEQGKFRRDLYYRIHVVRVALPPLRERPDDIALLLQHFLARRGGKLRVLPATVRALQGYAWPGNVRELENEVQRWIALCDGVVAPEDLSPAIRGADPVVDPDDLRIRPRVDRLERDLIARALERARGNQTRAADLLGLSRFGLQKKLRKLDAPDAPDDGEGGA